VIRVEHCLLPVCVGIARASGEAYRRVTDGEVDVKVGNKSVHGVCLASVESEVGCERCVCGLHLHHVQSLDDTAHSISIAEGEKRKTSREMKQRHNEQKHCGLS